jgi:hypothetical protein
VRNGDMTLETSDVIVNAANTSLDHACKKIVIVVVLVKLFKITMYTVNYD